MARGVEPGSGLENVYVTATGWIVNRGAMTTYNEAYGATGDRTSALLRLHEEALTEDVARLARDPAMARVLRELTALADESRVS